MIADIFLAKIMLATNIYIGGMIVLYAGAPWESGFDSLPKDKFFQVKFACKAHSFFKVIKLAFVIICY